MFIFSYKFSLFLRIVDFSNARISKKLVIFFKTKKTIVIKQDIFLNETNYY